MKQRRVKQRSNKMPVLLILLGISVLVLLFTTFLQIRIPYKSSAQTPSFTCMVNTKDYTKTVLVYCSTKPQSNKVCYPANPPFIIDCEAVRTNKVGNVCSTAKGEECKNNIAPTAIFISKGVPKATIVPTLKVSPTSTPFSIDSLTTYITSAPPQGEKLVNQVTTKINSSKSLLLLAVYVEYGNNSSSSFCTNKDYPIQTVGTSIPLLKNLSLITKKTNDSIEFYYRYYLRGSNKLQSKYLFSIPKNLTNALITLTNSFIPNEQVMGSGKFTTYDNNFGLKNVACLVLNK